ncbi:L-histidine N(alpha)-methyltransferase [Belliella aquatica]|uniref:Dimethylhistidine N-methyltransferase n=1 Tax=Belliella aquatica TaxID=1323734 RepID=A0ABQ1LV59_9BACT|nr:L-histidine N(alpha)-methyltransferase [Belliella aquatica]MCH7407240.1 L-histidine N(alpha)-methyltransferase [Belliella aquatica]GGC29525.1 dimethylhistidine N-methyltransferase [Belliella aquatica]
MNQFLNDVISGLTSVQKTLPSKYFYDEKGSRIFQEIMALEEYYLPECEVEILQNSSQAILSEIQSDELDIIELGAGDGSKTVIFLKEAFKTGKSLTYIPMDISPDILEINRELIKSELPELKVKPIPGDYGHTSESLKERKSPKLVLFMGSNIGNFPREKATEFIRFVNDLLQNGDFFLMGVDLKKNPHIIRAAYNDKEGVTKRFNLNLLERINRELDADFELSSFEHYGVYNPLSGSALSFLVSLQDQTVTISGQKIHFEKFETINTEISQKYSLKELDQIGAQTGFSWDKHFTDEKGYFSLSLFRK